MTVAARRRATRPACRAGSTTSRPTRRPPSTSMPGSSAGSSRTASRLGPGLATRSPRSTGRPLRRSPATATVARRRPGTRTSGSTDAADVGAAVEPAGGTLVAPPESAGPAGRSAILRDPAGAEMRLWEPGTNGGAELVNADGTWNWSNLHTPDLAGAPGRSTAALFGWELHTFDLGGVGRPHVAPSRLRRPPRRPRAGDPRATGRRRRTARRSPTPWRGCSSIGLDELPHWHVTFAVADAAATRRAPRRSAARSPSSRTRAGPDGHRRTARPARRHVHREPLRPARLAAG